MTGYAASFAGGALIGASAALLLLLNGRIAGVSGIAAGIFTLSRTEGLWRMAFLVGLVLGPIVLRLMTGAWPAVTLEASWPLLIAGGLLVGFGTRLGAGCTSGHGVCGLARLSRRSLVAVAVFMAAAIITVFLVRHGWSR